MANGQDAPPNQARVVAPAPTGGDGEIKAMNAVVEALKPLTAEERRRVLEYVLGRFGALPIQQAVPLLTPSVAVSPSAAGGQQAGTVHDIRTLKEVKSPKSANEMAALVAFYVSELAPSDERRNTITKTDIERYF